MCWKCCLCMCCCSSADTDAEQTNADINRMIDAEQAELSQLKVRSIEDKNWVRFVTVQRGYFIHGSGAAPVAIRDSGSLDPRFGREICKVDGRPDGKYLLAFACKDNMVPSEVKLSGAAAMLWGPKDFPYIYIFHVEGGTEYFQSPSNQPQQDARQSAETGFPDAVPWAQVDRVFQYNAGTGLYEQNKVFGL